MAKCARCGKGGLFHRVDKNGFCRACAEIVAREQHLSELERRCAEAQAACEDREGLLREAKEEAKSEARKQLDVELPKLQKEFDEKTRSVSDLDAKLADLSAKLTQTEKKQATAESKIEVANRAYKMLKHAINLFPADFDKSEMAARIREVDTRVEIETPPINCLTMKDLRRQYKQIERQITELCRTYAGRYTTKANAAIYKLMVMALEAELRNVMHDIGFGKLDDSIERVKEMTAKYYAIAAEGNQSIAPTLQKFIGSIEYLYIDAVKTEYEYFVRRERAKEEQRAIKEQMRQEAEERKRLEQERKHVENEEKKYQLEIERITSQIATAAQAEIDALNKRLAEVQAQLKAVEGKKAEIINLQNRKAGTVYIISNIGSFGDNIFKIGMTRRLEPQERVNELGDASVPFPFDVHSFIFSEDAVSLENALHKELNDRRVNKVNLRKEFFNVTPEELQSIVERIDPTAPFRMTALAEQYRQSLSITDMPTIDDHFYDEDDESA